MPGTITSDQTVIKAAEVTGDYLVLGTFGTAQALNDDIKVEGTNAINGRVSVNSAWSLAAAAAAIDMTPADTHVWIWLKSLTWPSMDTKANGGLGLSISSDTTPTLTGVSPSNGPTNSKTWYLDGSDTNNTAGWVCYCVDPNGTPDLTLGTPVMSSVDRVGLRAKVTGTVSNKTLNIQHDVIRYGTGLLVKDGTIASPVTFQDIYTSDSSSTNAWGVLTREAGIYFGAGRIRFGNTSQTAQTVFTETNKTLVFRDFPVANSFYGFVLAANTTAPHSTIVQFGTYSGGVTSAGCSLSAAGTRWWNLTVGGESKFLCYDSVLSRLLTANLSSNSEIRNSTLVTCGTIDVANAVINGVKFNSPANTQLKVDTTAEMSNIANSSFTMGSNGGHAIELTATGTYTFSSLTFTSYGANTTANAAVYNNSGGAVTINVTGTGTTPTIRNGVGASTTVNSNISITLTGLKNPSEVRVFSAGTTTEIAGSETVTSGSFIFSVGSGVAVDIAILALGYQNLRILNYSTTSDTSLPISQVIDRQYLNP